MLNTTDDTTVALSTEAATQINQDNGHDTLTASEFMNLIRQKTVRVWTGCSISGDVDLRGATISEPLVMKDVVFNGAVNFSGAHFKRGVDLRGCRFAQQLILSDSFVDGSLKLDDINIGVEAKEGDTPQAQPVISAEFDNLRVTGSLSLMNARVHGNLSCNHAKVENDLRIDGTRIYGNFLLRRARLGELRTDWMSISAEPKPDVASVEDETCSVEGRLDLTSATITGDIRLIGITIGKQLSLQGAEINGNLLCRAREGQRTHLKEGAWLVVVRVKGVVDFSGALITGELNLQGAKIGDSLLLRTTSNLNKDLRCVITDRVWLLGATTAGDVDISGAQIQGDLMMQNGSIGQNLLAMRLGGYQTWIDGDVELNGVRIRRAVELSGIELRGELNLDRASIDGSFSAVFDLDEENDWQVCRSNIHGGIHAESATFGKEVVLAGITVGTSNALNGSKLEERGVTLVGAQINGELSVCAADLVEEIIHSKNLAFVKTKITEERAGQLSTQIKPGTEIHGDLRLTRAQVLGGILLDGVKIEGNLDLRDASVRAKIDCRPIEVSGEWRRAEVRHVDFEALDMTGDLTLTGLTITGSPPDGRDGNLILRDSRIRGRLELYPLPDKGPPEQIQHIASIRGDLRLDAAEISYLIVSGRTFEEQAFAQGKPSWRSKLASEICRVVAFTKLLLKGGQEEQVPRIRFLLERATIGRLHIVEPLPGPLDLSNLKVDRWSLPDDQSIYKQMLGNSYPFKRSNYLMIENALRNAGLDEQADKVHVSMRQRDRASNKNLWKVWFDVFLDVSIKYGTTSKRLVGVMLILFGLSVSFFLDPKHLEYKIAPVWVFSDPKQVEQRIAPLTQEPLGEKHPSEWSIREAALFAATLSVPIVSLGIEERLQPSGIGLKAYAMGVVAANWVMWPLLIASTSGFIRKRD